MSLSNQLTESGTVSPTIFQPEDKPSAVPPAKPMQYFHGRPLPEHLINLAAPEGKVLFKESLNQGYAEGFFELASCFAHQMEPAYCSLSSLAIVLNALQVKDAPVWKGPWRWWSDELLNCCQDIEKVKKSGVTFSQFTCLAKCHCDVVAKRADQISKEEFLSDLKTVSQRSDVFMVISFSRKTLKQTGDGHFSPIGAYHPGRNMALVLDTARFKYPSYFASVDLLYESMQPIDKETNFPRGYFLLSNDSEHRKPSLCNVAQMRGQPAINWDTVEKTLCKEIPEELIRKNPQTLEEVVEIIVGNPIILTLQHTIDLDRTSITASSVPDGDAREKYVQELLKETTTSALYPVVQSYLKQQQQELHREYSEYDAAFATLFLLAAPSALYGNLHPDLMRKLEFYRDQGNMSKLMSEELKRIHEEIRNLIINFCQCGTGNKFVGDSESVTRFKCCFPEIEHNVA